MNFGLRLPGLTVDSYNMKNFRTCIFRVQEKPTVIDMAEATKGQSQICIVATGKEGHDVSMFFDSAKEACWWTQEVLRRLVEAEARRKQELAAVAAQGEPDQMTTGVCAPAIVLGAEHEPMTDDEQLEADERSAESVVGEPRTRETEYDCDAKKADYLAAGGDPD